MFFVCSVEVDAVQTTDCEREHYLDEAKDTVSNVREGHLDAVENTHLAGLFSQPCCRREAGGRRWWCWALIKVSKTFELSDSPFAGGDPLYQSGSESDDALGANYLG